MEFDKLCRTVAEILGLDVTELTGETRFVEDLGADSLDMYQIVLKLEEEFEVQMEVEELEKVHTISDAMALIVNRK